MISSVTDITAACGRRVKNRWAQELILADSFPYTISTRSRGSIQNADEIPELQRRIEALKVFAHRHGLELIGSFRQIRPGKVSPITLWVPTSVVFPDLDTAAHIAGTTWCDRIASARRTIDVLRLAEHENIAVTVLKATKDWSHARVDMLATSAEYFRRNGSAAGFTARQVPLPGVDSKWLAKHEKLVQLVAGLDDLGLVARGKSIEYVYRDPTYVASGGRRHDSLRIGDVATPAYLPRIVVLCENKDSADHFPPTEAVIAVLCQGDAAGVVLGVDWIKTAPVVLYWGDLDADGFEIVDYLRRSGLTFETIGMDVRTIQAYGHLGTNYDQHGRLIVRHDAKPLARLSDDERAAYELLCSPDYTGYRRIEQERIDLEYVRKIVTDRTCP